jgi:hypothetical protein
MFCFPKFLVDLRETDIQISVSYSRLSFVFFPKLVLTL